MNKIILFFMLIAINVFCFQSIETIEDGKIYYTKGQELGFVSNVHASRTYVTDSYIYSSYNGNKIPVGTMVKYFAKRNTGYSIRPFLVLDGQYAGEWVNADIKKLTATKEEAMELQKEADELIEAEKNRENKKIERKLKEDSERMTLLILSTIMSFIGFVLLLIIISLKPNKK